MPARPRYYVTKRDSLPAVKDRLLSVFVAESDYREQATLVAKALNTLEDIQTHVKPNLTKQPRTTCIHDIELSVDCSLCDGTLKFTGDGAFRIIAPPGYQLSADGPNRDG